MPSITAGSGLRSGRVPQPGRARPIIEFGSQRPCCLWHCRSGWRPAPNAASSSASAPSVSTSVRRAPPSSASISPRCLFGMGCSSLVRGRFRTSGNVKWDAHGPDNLAQFEQVATYIDHIFKGAKPADLPVQAPTKYELVRNLKTAHATRPRRAAFSVGSRRRGDRIACGSLQCPCYDYDRRFC